MAKKKDHLMYTDKVVQGVIFETPVKVLCGFEKVFTRADFEDLDYRDTCKECVAAAAGLTAPEPMSVLPKLGWTFLVEQAWKDLYENSIRPARNVTNWSFSGVPTFTAYSFGKKAAS